MKAEDQLIGEFAKQRFIEKRGYGEDRFDNEEHAECESFIDGYKEAKINDSGFLYFVGKTAQQEEKLEQADALIKSLDEYIILLGKELDGVIGMASLHGWRSNLVKEGEEARETINRLRGFYKTGQ